MFCSFENMEILLIRKIVIKFKFTPLTAFDSFVRNHQSQNAPSKHYHDPG